MSVTKLKNAEGELISQVDIDSEKFSPKSSRCSCPNCDSVGCFEKRKKAVQDRCQCSICRELRNCSTLSKNNNRGDKGVLENVTKKIVKEVVTRETIESLKRVTETMYEFGTNENLGMITRRTSKLSDDQVLPTPTKSQLSNKICCNKRSIGDNEDTDKKECCKQRLITDIGQPLKIDNTATKLSAQVMNVPYEDLHESVPSTNELAVQNPLSKLNIFKRIKEIYDACSCKVCECISSKPRDLREDFCKCQPCKCEDCVKLRKKIEEKIRRIPHSGCPCIRCDRKDCRGIVKNTSESQACDCNPGDNIQYPKNLEHCNCEPCQCINCRLLGSRTTKTVKLGQVNEIIQRETCRCSPCECIECKQIYNRTNPTIMSTQSKTMSKYGNYCRCHNCRAERCRLGAIETCQCGRHSRPMRKSFDKNYNDYDVRTVIVDNNGPFNQQNECNFKEHNAVTLFASLKNNYPNNSCNKGVCKCAECECIVCSARDNSLRNYRENLRHDVMSVQNNITLTTPITDACKCTPCECEICSRRGEREDGLRLESKCRCDVCDCLNCDNNSLATSSFPSSSTPSQSYSIHKSQPVKPIKNMAMNKNCGCHPCDCSNCKKLFSCSSSVKFYPNGKTIEKKTQRLRKVMLITPSTSESRLKSRKTYLQSVSSTSLNSKPSIEGVFRQDLSTCHAISHDNAIINNWSKTNKNQVCQLYQNHNDYNIVSEEDFDREMFFNLNNPVLDTASFKSVEETPILNYTCDFTRSTFQSHKIVTPSQDKPSESKYKSFFNIIHDEQPHKITSNDSDVSLPVFWTCSSGTSYQKKISKNIKVACKEINSKKDSSDNLTKTQCPINIKYDFNEKANEKSRNELFIDNDKSKDDNGFTEYLKCSYNNKNYTCDNECINNWEKLHKYTNSLSILVDNNQENRKSTINDYDVTIDYERATRVLSEAKAFSSKLIKMLDSFETANRQFESASQKFKVLHESLLDINESELKKTYSMNLGTMHKPIFEETYENLSAVHDNYQTIDKNVKNENEAEREYEQPITKLEEISDKIQNTSNGAPTKYDTSVIYNINNTNNETKDINAQETEKSTVNDVTIIQKTNSQPEFAKAANNVEMFSTSKTPLMHISDSTNLDSSASDIDKEATNELENNNIEKNIQTPTIELIMNKLDSVFGNVTITDTAVATDDVEKHLAGLSKQQDKQPWQIFKKNLYINGGPYDRKTVFQSPALELDIKEAIQAISLQTTSENYTKVTQRPNAALANLQSEVNDLLNMPLLQTNSHFKSKTQSDIHSFTSGKLDLELKSMSSTASSQTYEQVIERADKEVYFNNDSETNKVSCDQLKANFIGLRRVSDHTVLVKWNVPKRINDVQGYELLVDGRAVQKIFSPTRRMAVVTCLPHAARVLLTIRTIATADCGHAPTSSIVYRPRK